MQTTVKLFLLGFPRAYSTTHPVSHVYFSSFFFFLSLSFSVLFSYDKRYPATWRILSVRNGLEISSWVDHNFPSNRSSTHSPPTNRFHRLGRHFLLRATPTGPTVNRDVTNFPGFKGLRKGVTSVRSAMRHGTQCRIHRKSIFADDSVSRLEFRGDSTFSPQYLVLWLLCATVAASCWPIV